MNCVKDCRQDPKAYIESMRQANIAFKKLMHDDPEKAREQARLFFIHSGIFNADGSPKKGVVSLGMSF